MSLNHTDDGIDNYSYVTNNNNSEDEKRMLFLVDFEFGINIFVAVLGTITNLTTIVALLRQSQLRNVSFSFVISLSLADLIFCSIVLPLYGSIYYGSKIYEITWLCKLVPFAFYGNFGTSILSIVMITINRYVKVVHPFMYELIYTSRNTAQMIGFTWLGGYVVLIPTLLGVWGQFGYAENYGCDILEDSTKNLSSIIVFLLCLFLLPCITMIYCYSRIFWLFIKSKSNIQTLGTQVNGENVRLVKEFKKTKMIFVIFITFLVCYLPNTITVAIQKNDFFMNFKHNYEIFMLSWFLVKFSACVNPFIYAGMNLQYRQAYVDLFHSLCKPCRRVILHRDDVALNSINVSSPTVEWFSFDESTVTLENNNPGNLE